MNFFERAGRKAIGSRLRFLTETITADAAEIFKLYNIPMQPKWFPVFFILAEGGNQDITGIAKEIGHSHVSVSKIIREMNDAGLIKEKKDKKDGRRTMVTLSPKAQNINLQLQEQYHDVGQAVEEISAAANHDLWQAIQEWEFLLQQKSLLRRVQEIRKARQAEHVSIIPYTSKYRKAFKDLNEEWISKWFVMEKADHHALDNPKSYILDKGGVILVALYQGEPVGVCALIKMKDPVYQYELAKMAVSPSMRGRNVGWLLANAIIDKARSLKARAIYLESNTILKPAISLYHKLGFKKVVGRPSPYERSNIQMELILGDNR
jgi:DNA-binding MarR family transcriptional regulator/predicted GNAT family N-acyltransferase